MSLGGEVRSELRQPTTGVGGYGFIGKAAQDRKAVTIGRFAGYAVVGAIGTVLHAACTIGCVEVLGLHPVAASAIGFVVALVTQYLLNNAFVFRAGPPGFAQFLRYTLVSVGGLMLNLGIMYTVVEILRWPYQAGIVIAILVCTPVNFMLNRGWSFRQADRPNQASGS